MMKRPRLRVMNKPLLFVDNTIFHFNEILENVPKICFIVHFYMFSWKLAVFKVKNQSESGQSAEELLDFWPKPQAGG